MIAPSRLQLYLVGVVALPALTVAGTSWAVAGVAFPALAGVIALVALDLALSLDRLRAVSIELPALVHAIVGRETPIRGRARFGAGAPRSVQVALQVPEGVTGLSTQLRLDAPRVERPLEHSASPVEHSASPVDHSASPVERSASPVDHSASPVEFSVRPTARGQHRATRLYFETSSRLRLWSLRKTEPIDVEVRTYPELLFDQQQVAAALPRASDGTWALRDVGRGRDFERLREYVPGDSSDDLHWRATAKRRRPITKLYQVERSREVYVAIDASRLSTRHVAGAGPAGSRRTARDETTLLERYIVAALLLGKTAERLGDLFGWVGFDDDVRAFVRAGRGRAHFRACREATVGLGARPVSPDFRQMFSFFDERVRRRSALYVLTSLDDPAVAEEFAEGAALVARRHLVVAATLRLPHEQPLFTGAPVHSVEEVYDRLEGHISWKRQRVLRRVLQQSGVSLISFDQQRVVPTLIRAYVSRETRRAP